MPQKTGNVLSWAPDIDGKTLAQAQRSAALPFIAGHVALMPDAHFGYGATVGSVIPTKGAIIPSAVGVDIGCGMIASRLNLDATQLPDDLHDLHARISKTVPAGVGTGHDKASTIPDLPATRGEKWWSAKLIGKAESQYGSLGSGNHFIEVCLDENADVWIVLHSGSRGVGKMLADVHIDGAKDMMKRYFIQGSLPDGDLDLAYLVENTPEFDAYIADMLWAQEYAMGNRERMLRLVFDAVHGFLGRSVGVVETINCHHNFTDMEHHRGQNLWITRKGAIRAREGDRGVIPGSMGTASYIVHGRGSPASYSSCSHGAGRRMSRGEAKRTLDHDGLVEAMKGKVWNGDPKALIDEDPRAYKSIDDVMEAQRDLVKVEHRLHQILNYKGA